MNRQLTTWSPTQLASYVRRTFRDCETQRPTIGHCGDSRYSNIGILICYDIWFPEAVRALTLSGADLLCVPTNWVPLVAGNSENDTAMANILCTANSHCNGLPIVAADRCGQERGQLFLGRSVITHATGWPAAGPAPADREDVLTADIDVDNSTSARQWGEFNNPLTNRRTDAYRVEGPLAR